MPDSSQVLTIGIEEEVFMVDRETRSTISGDFPEEILRDFNQEYPDQLVHEFLCTQVEMISKPCNNIAELRDEVTKLRSLLFSLGQRYGLAPLAASTHPFVNCYSLAHNTSKRYERLADVLGFTARRMAVCGMHLHIGVDDPEVRLSIYNRLRWFLPHMLALSTSSPFWNGRATGQNSYRLSVIDGLPRSGLPQPFKRLSVYQQYIDTLAKAGSIKDASEIWWDLRMSCRFPTIEMRITDICSRVEDAMAIAALYQSMVHYFLHHEQDDNHNFNMINTITYENRWRAQRFPLGTNAGLISAPEFTLEQYFDVYQTLVDTLMPSAIELGCEKELQHVMNICRYGTSADRQRNLYQELLKTEGEQVALEAVVDLILKDTAKDVWTLS